MMPIINFLILVLVCTNLINKSISEDVNKTSSNNSLEIINDNLNETFSNNNCSDIENNNCSNASTLNLSSTGLTQYPVTLTNYWFPNLKQLNLSSNQIKNLSQSVLSRSGLEILDLSYNQLNTIDEDTFKNLVSLKYLNLSNNQITSLNMFAFACDEHNLIELDLSGNQITDNSMEFLLFSSLTKLKLLNLNSNKLTSLSNHLLYNLYSLEILLLSNNNLKSFDLFRLNQNNEFLTMIDLSYNHDLKFDIGTTDSEDDNYNNLESSITTSSKYINNVEFLNLASIDMTNVNMNRFLDMLFEQYQNLKYLNMSYTRSKLIWSEKWPHKIQIIDLSNNFIRDGQLDCTQFKSNFLTRLEFIYLNNNQMKNFKKFVENCSPLLNGFNSSILIDLRNNLFESIESIYTNSTSLNESNDYELSELCKNEPNLSSLLLSGNPLICDCDENSWWSNIYSNNLNPTLFNVNKEYCISIKDYDSLNCMSMSTNKLSILNKIDSNEIIDEHSTVLMTTKATPMKFDSIRSDIIKPQLICQYKYSCSSSSCECCGFRACDCSFSCPAQCRCARNFEHSYDIINCTSVNINTIPNNLPEMATDVLLDNNNLKRISPHQFFGRFYIRKIDLSRNQLGFIEENAFNGLSQLKVLKLSENNLQILLGYEFRDLFQLEELHLDKNNIQFISNLTFTYLINLRYLNLKLNNLRHNLEFKIYFLYNTNLINLTSDAILAPISQNNNNNNLIPNVVKPNNNFIIKSIQNKKSLKISNSTTINLTYLNLITQLLQQSKLNSNINYGILIRCLFDKFKEIINVSYKSNSININSQIMDKNFKIIFLNNFENLKLLCLKKNETFHDMKNNYMKLIDNNNNDDDNENDDDQYYYNSHVDTSLLSKKLKLIQLNDNNNNAIVLNYTTIVWLSLLLVVIVILFSVLFSFLILKVQKSKKLKFDLAIEKSVDGTTDCLNQTGNVVISMRKKFTKLFNRIAKTTKINEKSIVDLNNISDKEITYDNIKYKECPTNDSSISSNLNKKKMSHYADYKNSDQRLDIRKKLKSNRQKYRNSYSSTSSFKSSSLASNSNDDTKTNFIVNSNSNSSVNEQIKSSSNQMTMKS